MSPLTIAVIMGGPSREHDISLRTGEIVIEELENKGHKLHKVLISLIGEWSIDGSKPLTSAAALKKIRELSVDTIFLALHGSFGEDGTVQALLQREGLKFTGSHANASILAMNKVVAGDVFTQNGVKVPEAVAFSRYELIKDSHLGERVSTFDFPLIVKPANQGSSLGVTLVQNQNDLSAAIEFALEHDNTIMVQRYIAGREVSCGVIERAEDSKLRALPPTELTPVNADFFDYYAKYVKGGANEVTPPDMPKQMIERIQATAVKCHELLGCSGYSRTDMILAGSKIYVIEINTLPGMTKTSILPQQAQADGLSFINLLEGIIQCSLN